MEELLEKDICNQAPHESVCTGLLGSFQTLSSSVRQGLGLRISHLKTGVDVTDERDNQFPLVTDLMLSAPERASDCDSLGQGGVGKAGKRFLRVLSVFCLLSYQR